MADAKMVRTIFPAGVSANFVAHTGDSHHAYPVSKSLIGKMIERGVLVYEQLKESSDTDVTEVLLNSDTYLVDNSDAIEVGSDTVIVPDIESEIAVMHATEREEWLTQYGLTIKENQEALAKSFLGITESETTVENITDEVEDLDDDNSDVNDDKLG